MSLVHLPHLFVEGKTDKYVIVQLLKNHGLFAHDDDTKTKTPDKVQVVVSVIKSTEGSSGSKSEILDDIPIRLRSPKHSAIGYIIDADDPAFTDWNLQKTWQSVCDRLEKTSVDVEKRDAMPADGFYGLQSKTNTLIGVWLMPDNQRDGSVEDFLRELIDEGDRIASFAETSTRCAKDDHGALFPEKDFKKAAIETWLAWQEEPGMSFGTAFQKDCLQKNKPLAERFVAWVRNLIAAVQLADSEESKP